MRHACFILLAVLLTAAGQVAAPPPAQPDISGTWQASIEAAASPARIAWVFSRDRAGGWQMLAYSVNRGTDPVKASTVRVDGRAVKVAVDPLAGAFEGTLSPDGQSLEGTWTVMDVKTPLLFHRATRRTAWQLDPSAHTVRFVTVDHDVNLEVLDWGGKGRPVVLLAGLGNTAHVFDPFAPRLLPSYHVLAITRRGFGASSAPAGGYDSDRLADDVLEVLQALKITRPVLIGHSIAGQELSSIGTRHPEIAAGLVYLDAGYGYALYSGGDLNFDVDELRKKLDVLRQGDRSVAQQLLATDLPRVTRDLQTMPADASLPRRLRFIGPLPPAVQRTILAGGRKYFAISAVPILAIFSDPVYSGGLPDEPPADKESRMKALAEAAVAFEQAMPAAHVVRLAHATHDVFRSNEADVLREINAFMASLPPAP
jgi:pimeloyl-ACP methyl ester carboxylesterase